jgi:ADP-ribose pyrophosphatase YjhB (NUDIX family)
MLPPHENSALLAMTGFTLRVYGLWLRAGVDVLIAHEFYRAREMYKFPGGGLEPGESTIDGLKREFLEEMGISIKVLSHFYTTDFLVRSSFDPQVQVISIYYLVEGPADFKPLAVQAAADQPSFRFVPLQTLQPARDLSFPIDQRVAAMLQEQFMP